MANDLNQCNFIGRLGQDPESKYLPSGDPVTEISIAVGWKGKDKEGVEWVPVVAFGKLAENLGKYLAKGSQVYVSGRFKTDKWQSQSGETHTKSRIIADKVQFLDSRTEPASGAGQSQPSANPAGGQGAGVPPQQSQPSQSGNPAAEKPQEHCSLCGNVDPECPNCGIPF